jgi:hypothetical protein
MLYEEGLCHEVAGPGVSLAGGPAWHAKGVSQYQLVKMVGLTDHVVWAVRLALALSCRHMAKCRYVLLRNGNSSAAVWQLAHPCVENEVGGPVQLVAQ